MYIKVRSSLVFQKSALELLHIYLQSEHSCLRYGHFARIEILERAITRLVQNAFDNHLELKRILDGASVREYAATQDEQLGRPLVNLVERIEGFQEDCGRQAALNKALARALDEEQMVRIGAMYGVPPQEIGLEPVRYQ